VTVLDWLFTLTGALFVAWVATLVAIMIEDRRARRKASWYDDTVVWRAKVAAMRRLEEQDRDLGGSA